MNNTASFPLSSEPNQLWWSLPCGLLLWLLIVVLFGRLLSTPEADTTVPLPIDARLVVLPEPQQPPAEQKPTPPAPPIIKPQHKEIVVPRKMPVPQSPQVEQPVDRTSEPPPKANPQLAPPPPPAPVTPPITSNATAHMGAKAIYQPLPQIPDELRDEAISAIAMARFHINPDGTASVELIKPTQNPRINQIILNTLKTWKFFPALQDGKPIPSTQDIKVNVNVS
ncbi:MAG: energy transducer TonB [Burkholderiaceae bacterium]